MKETHVHTHGEDVGATVLGHMVLLDGLVEGGLAQQQESQANPHGQQPGHGEAKSAVGHTAGRHTTEDERATLQMPPCIFTEKQSRRN